VEQGTRQGKNYLKFEDTSPSRRPPLSRLRSALYVYLITFLFLYIYISISHFFLFFSLSHVGVNKYISLFESQGQKEIVTVSEVREVSRV